MLLVIISCQAGKVQRRPYNFRVIQENRRIAPAAYCVIQEGLFKEVVVSIAFVIVLNEIVFIVVLRLLAAKEEALLLLLHRLDLFLLLAAAGVLVLARFLLLADRASLQTIGNAVGLCGQLQACCLSLL